MTMKSDKPPPSYPPLARGDMRGVVYFDSEIELYPFSRIFWTAMISVIILS